MAFLLTDPGKTSTFQNGHRSYAAWQQVRSENMVLTWYYYAHKSQRDKVSLPPPEKSIAKSIIIKKILPLLPFSCFSVFFHCSNIQYDTSGFFAQFMSSTSSTVQSNLVSSNFVTFCLCWRSVMKMYAMHHLEEWKSWRNVNLPEKYYLSQQLQM